MRMKPNGVRQAPASQYTGRFKRRRRSRVRDMTKAGYLGGEDGRSGCVKVEISVGAFSPIESINDSRTFSVFVLPEHHAEFIKPWKDGP